MEVEQPSEATVLMASETQKMTLDVEADASKASKDLRAHLLQKANELIAVAFQHDLVTLYVDDEACPILSVLKTRGSDPFYVDQALLHANLSVNDEGVLEFSLLSPNRELIRDIAQVYDLNSELPVLLKELSDSELESCSGFQWQDPRLGTLFQRLRKSDIDTTLIERYNGSIIYRSRTCKYSYNKVDDWNEKLSFFTNQCKNCQTYLSDLDVKYTGGQILKTSATLSDESLEQEKTVISDDNKRKRGRPKGSKNKSYLIPIEEEDVKLEKTENDENDDPSERVLVDDPDYVFGSTEVADDDDNDEADLGQDSDLSAASNLRRGFRKRITTKRQKALLETKRKRGRPPLKVGPIDCPDCGKTYDTAKDYRKHCLEHANSFACTLGECVKRFKSQKDLDVHLRKHRGEKPYVCSECDKAYAIRQDLRMHMRKHTGLYYSISHFNVAW